MSVKLDSFSLKLTNTSRHKIGTSSPSLRSLVSSCHADSRMPRMWDKTSIPQSSVASESHSEGTQFESQPGTLYLPFPHISFRFLIRNNLKMCSFSSLHICKITELLVNQQTRMTQLLLEHTIMMFIWFRTVRAIKSMHPSVQLKTFV
jgi:hypothetical protein